MVFIGFWCSVVEDFFVIGISFHQSGVELVCLYMLSPDLSLRMLLLPLEQYLDLN